MKKPAHSARGRHKALDDLDVAYLRSILRYDPDTGLLHWLIRGSGIVPGKPAGCVGPRSVSVMIGKRNYKAHRVAWALKTGAWPDRDVDHEDRDGCNNRWPNLRLATVVQNLANRGVRSDSQTGVKNVLTRRGRFLAYIQKGGKRVHLGTFDTAGLAAAAYAVAAREVHGEFAVK